MIYFFYKHPLSIFTVLMSFLCTSPLSAQAVFKLKNDDITISNLKKPSKWLPDSLKTYRVVSKIILKQSSIGLDDRLVMGAFSLESFEKKAADADMILSVTVKDFTRSSVLRSQKADSVKTYYWYDIEIKPQIDIEIKNKRGDLIYSKNNTFYGRFESLKKYSESEAKYELSQTNDDAKVREAYFNALKSCAALLKNTFDSQPDVVSFYYKTAKDAPFVENVNIIKHALSLLNNRKNKADIVALIKPNIDFFEKELPIAAQKDKRKYLATLLNLSNIYRSLEDYDKALSYMRLMIAGGYEWMPHVAHLADMKDRFDKYTYIKITGGDLDELVEKTDALRFNFLKIQEELEGYIVLKNGNKKVKGTMLNFANNFKNNKIVMKYEKELNKDATDIVYTPIDVAEVHAENWHFAVIPYKNFDSRTVYLAEILYQSPRILLCKTLPKLEIKNNRLLGLKGTDSLSFTKTFLRKNDDVDFTLMSDFPGFKTFDGTLSSYLKDCSIVSQQAKFGYYTEKRLLQAVKDYDSFCAPKQNNRTLKQPTEQAEVRTFKGSTGASSYLGISTGANNFVSLFGMNVDIRLHGKLFGRTGLGFGTWGAKFSAGLKLDARNDMRFSKGWSLGVGYSHSRGLKSITVGTDQSTTVLGNTTVKKIDVDIRPLPADAVNVSAIYNKFLGKKKALIFEIGYSKLFQKQPWLVNTPKIKAEDVKSLVKLYQPGGLILGFGINFSLK